MDRSLDGLIHHLLDQVALCGEHGALPSDFINYVETYYSHSDRTTEGASRPYAVVEGQNVLPNVDRLFLERVWQWLIRNSEIQLGDHVGHQTLTLSEAEVRNAVFKQANKPSAALPHSTDGATVALAEGLDTPVITQSTERNQLSEVAVTANPVVLSGAATNTTTEPSAQSHADIEVPETVVEAASLETSSIVQARSSSDQHGQGDQPASNRHDKPEPVSGISDSASIIRLYTSENRMWHALAGHNPDLNKIKALDFALLSMIAARGPKGIHQHELVKLSGQDKRSLPARTDRLHDDGYIKKQRVSVQQFNPKRLLNTSHLMLKRFVKDSVSQSKQVSTATTPANRAIDVRDEDHSEQGAAQRGLAAIDQIEPASQNGCTPRLIPQWTPDRNLSNQIFNLVALSGIQGMTMRDIRENLLGEHVRKPIEEYVIRLVECWQMSQPLHLRHLSIVRDTVLRGKTNVFIYYTFDNFQKLVEKGNAFWEAVTTVPDGATDGINVAASLSAKPMLDENGFPMLDSSLFQGNGNDATLSDCVAALKVDRMRVSGHDPVLKRQANGTYAIKYKTTKSPGVPRPVNRQSKESTSSFSKITSVRPNFDKRLVNLSPEHSTPTSKRHKSLLVQRIGRPRKYDKSSALNDVGNEDLLPKKEIHRSEKMAEKYVRRKIEDEISWRLEEGGDAVSVTKQVLAEVMALRKEEGQEPLPTPSTEMIFQKFAGGPEPGPIKGKSRGRRKRAPYWPSMAAHTIPIPKSLKKPGKGAQRPPQEADGILVSNVRKRRLPARLLESENEAGLSPLMKKRCRLIITDRVADIFCLPSVAAHSWPCIPPPSLKVRVSDGKEKRKPGRPRRPKDPATTLSEQEKATQPRFRYLPSIAAHSGVFLPLLLQPTKAPAKRKRAPKQPVERDAVPVALGSHSTDSQTPLPLQLRAVSEVGLAPVSSSLSHEGPYPGWIRFMSKYYDAELKSILRPHEGVFAGVTKPRRKRNCEPADFRPRNLKVIVFKCARLQQIEWFTTETECSKGVQSHVVARESPNRPFIQHILPSIPVQTPRTPIAEAPSQSQTPLNQSVKLPPFNPQPPLVELSNGIIGSVHPSMSPIAEGAMTDTIGSPRDFLPDEDRPPIMESLHPQVLQTTSSPIVQSSSASVGRVLPPFTEASDVATQESSCSVLDVAPHATTLESGNNTSLTEGTPAPVKDKQILVLYPANESMENEPNTADDNEGNRDKQDDAQHPDASMIDVSVLAGQSQSSTTGKKSDRTLDLVGSSVSHESVSNQPSTFPGASAVQIVEDTNVGQQNPTLSDSSLLRSFLSLSREIEARKGDENLVQESRSSEHPPPESDRNSARGAFKRFTRNSGSVPLLRERVVMDIIRRCEGVFPGYKEMCRPFAAEWSKIGQEGTPEEKTIKNAIDALHGKRQLQKHIYVFDSKQGIRVKGTILTLPDVDVADPRVKDIRANIMAYYPRNYFPPALESLAESLNTNVGHSTFVGEKHPELSQMINLGKNKAAKATLAAMKAEEQRHLERDTGTGEQAEGEDTDSSLDMIHGPVMRVPIVQHRPPSHTKGKRLRGGRVERPAGSRNSSNAVADQESLPQPASHQLNRSTELTWLPKEYAFSEYNFEEERPTVLEPTVLLDTHRLHAPYGQRLRPPKPPRRKKIKSSTDLPSQVRSSPPYSSPYAAETSWDKTEPSVEDTQTTSSPSPKPPGADSQLTWPVTGPKTAVPSQTVEQTHGFQLRLKEAVVNFMDATHYFYQTTGTFSVGFSGLSPARPINKKVGTCWKPYSLGPRNIHLEFPAPRGPRKLLPKRPLGAEDTQFEKEVDASLEWELETAELQHIRFKVLTFVNYTFHHAHVTAAAVDAMMDSIKEIQMSSRKGRMYTRKIPQLNNARPKIGKSIFSVGAKNISHAAAEAFKRIDSRASLKRRRLTSLVENQGHDETTEVPLDENSRPSKLRRIRGPRGARLLGEEGESRLLTAVTLVRTLTGGLEKRIDWVLAAKAFGPDTSVMFIQRRWSYVLQKHKMMLPKMEDDFQELFVEAYQKGTIPAIDFDNLAEYDWKWLTEWTMKQLRTASKTQPDLPTDRAKFHDLYELKEAPDVDISDYYGINGSGTTIASRTSLISKKAYVHAAVKDQEGVPSQELEQFKAAKTWVRANVITPEDTYNPSLARDKLRILPTHTIDDALKQLLLDKVLTQENKGRLIPGRNYDISEQFISRLKKNILPEHFQRAVAYKLHLDQKFEAQEFVPYSPTADDGEMLAIINLLAHQRIKLVPVSIPTKKWGHLDGKYESRQMDKTRLNFQMELHPTPAYVLGNPLRPLPEPPSQHLEDLAAKIPLWYDIHDAFVPVVWEMALAAVMAILAVRPGVGAEEIAKAMRPAMEAWELEKVLEWMAEAKAATRVGSGYLLDEWWWLAFAGKEDKGKGKERAVD